jgi:hypothetical protein
MSILAGRSSIGRRILASVVQPLFALLAAVHISSAADDSHAQRVLSVTGTRWQSIAVSGDARVIIAAPWNDPLAISRDSGKNWNRREGKRQWCGVASATDGTSLAACDSRGHIHISSDSGETWRQCSSDDGCSGVVMSADGKGIMAFAVTIESIGMGRFFWSSDGGDNWTMRGPQGLWTSLASSADCTRLVAGQVSGKIFISSDTGVSWSPRGDESRWCATACSRDGATMAAVQEYGKIHVSSDFGLSWLPCSDNGVWTGLSMSADGKTIVACTASVDSMDTNGFVPCSKVFVSRDRGATWRVDGPTKEWVCIAVSGDGLHGAACTQEGEIFVLDLEVRVDTKPR